MIDLSIDQEDERDEADRLLNPNPRRHEPLFPSVDEITDVASATRKVVVTVFAINRAIREIIPGCEVIIDKVSSFTNVKGEAQLDLSNLVDGEYDFSVTPADVSGGTVGPNFPIDPGKDRIGRAWKGRVTIHANAISNVVPEDWVGRLDRATAIMMKQVLANLASLGV